MSLDRVIFKIGGSIIERPNYLKNTISQFNQLVQDNLINKIIVIPGGASYANFIRKLDEELKIETSMAHWMAIYAMNYNGTKIAHQYPFIHLTEKIEELLKIDHSLSLFLPFKYLKMKDSLPHSWDVTSDSITLSIAHELGLNQCFLIKDVDGIFNQQNKVIQKLTTSNFIQLKESGKLAKINVSDKDIKKSKPIDKYSLEIIDTFNMSCILLNGALNSSRIYQYFASSKENEKIFTKISFS